MHTQSLSIVLPCFNEEGIIPATIADAQKWLLASGMDGEIVVVDDGSTDGTSKLLDSLARVIPILKIVRHPINKGYGSAIRSGCDAATKELIAFMDSDGQFAAAELTAFLPLFPEFDLVSGIRTKRADPFFRGLNSKIYRAAINCFFGMKVVDLECGMKAFKREIWPHIRPIYATGAFFDSELFFNMKKNDFRFAEVPVRHLPRTVGKPTGAKLRVILKTFGDLLRLVVHDGNSRFLFFPIYRGVKI